jgi:hypothetical protein
MARVGEATASTEQRASPRRGWVIGASLGVVVALLVGAGGGVLAFRAFSPERHPRPVTITPANVGSVLQGDAYVETAFVKVDGRILVAAGKRFGLPGAAVPLRGCEPASQLSDLHKGQYIEVYVNASTAQVEQVDCIYKR